MSKKDKVAQFNSIQAELDTLRLAMFDTVCTATKFPFVDTVKVDANDIDSTYSKGEFKYAVSVSKRCIPVYRLLTPVGVEFFTEPQIEAERNNQGICYRMLRHAIWLMGTTR